MAIRYLAQELYRWSRRVEELEKALAVVEPGDLQERSRLATELLQARKELEHYRAMLAAKKEKPLF
jgi:uncharacterized membrane protein YccC